MLPSASMRPDQPIAKVSNLPLSSRFSDVDELGRLEDDVDADRLLHGLDHLAEPCGNRVGAEHQVHGDAGRRPGTLERGLRSSDIGRQLARDPLRRGVERRAGRNREAVGVGRAAEDDLVDHLPVERQLERGPQVGRLRDRGAGVRIRQFPEPVRVADVDGDPLIADRRRLEQAQRGVAGDRLEIGRGDALADVDVVRPEVRGTRSGVGDDLPDDRVEVDVLLAVVVRRFRERDVVAGAAILELERPDAHGVRARTCRRARRAASAT